MNINIVFIGGDARMIYAAKALSERYGCFLYGFGDSGCGLPSHSPGAKYDIAVLPVVAGNGEIKLMSGGNSADCGIIAEMLGTGAAVFAGRAPEMLKSVCAEHRFSLYDYLEREELAVLNAQATAEGAVGIAVNELPGTVRGSSALVLGFGRIAKLTARCFSALGADVTVAARKKADLAWAEACSYKPVDITDASAFSAALGTADVILNTVPAPILSGSAAAAVRPDAALIELASVPCTGGEPQFRVIPAGGLPGKTAPRTAGNIIAKTIETILTERSIENGGA